MTTYVRNEDDDILFRVESGPRITEVESPLPRKKDAIELSNSPLNKRYTEEPAQPSPVPAPSISCLPPVTTSDSTTSIDTATYAMYKSRESAYTGRAISDVNRDVSNRMIAAASDSPPLIPRRDYEIQSNSSNFEDMQDGTLDRGRNKNDLVNEEDTEPDSCSPHVVHRESLPNISGPPEGFMGFAPEPFIPSPPGPPVHQMGPGRSPPWRGEQQLALVGPPGLSPPPEMMARHGHCGPPPPWLQNHPGPPPGMMQPGPAPHGPPPGRLMDPHMTGVFADPGLLMTPHGPMMPGPGLREPPKPPKRKKDKKNKQAMSRAQSMDYGFSGAPPSGGPPMPFPPLPPPPMIESPYGMMGPPAPYARSEQMGLPPFRLSLPAPYPRAHTECGSFIGGRGGMAGGSVIVGQPPLHKETRGSQLINQELVANANGNGVGKSGTINSDTLSNPSDKRLTEKTNHHSKCRQICCDSGLTTVIWVIIGLILLGLIIGLALGLTIV